VTGISRRPAHKRQNKSTKRIELMDLSRKTGIIEIIST